MTLVILSYRSVCVCVCVCVCVTTLSCVQTERKRTQKWTFSLMFVVYYRPQTKFEKVMFLHLSVSHSVHRGSTWAGTPPGKYPQAGTSPAGYPPESIPRAGTPPSNSACWDTVNKRAVSISLECILVCFFIVFAFAPSLARCDKALTRASR